MRFALTEEQRDFRDAVDSLLRDANGIAAARAWAAGDTKPGLAIWRGLAAIGMHSLAGEYPVELCAAIERVGYHAAPGPYPESLAVATAHPEAREQLAAGAIATTAVPPIAPYAPNADIADLCIPPADPQPVASLDPARSLFPVSGLPPHPDLVFDTAALLTAAQLLGLGRAALDMTVAYAKQRVQYGHAIGEYQAVKHRLADAHTGLEFARPLVFAAALSADPGDVSAAKAAASDAAYRAARAALQLHGAIGYTDEYDLSVYFKKIRALHSAWGSPSFHRDRLLRHIGDL
ncbi:acyl-CoA dehydrogenase family protein [Catenulispora rubra]|uniref:acyl-CoA dehydrogenase family protein n=1 Tax=Catenulispora rubra TaxID=280293 RepID=UPI0018924CA2|nr:acyl-CoA dehydrogenase family protein [Catenulispora rubra]